MEWLKNILGEDLYNQVKPKLDGAKVKIADISKGDYLPRDKFNEKNEENKLLKEQIEDYKKNNKDINKLVESNQELKSQIDTLNNDFSGKLKAKDKEISDISKKSALSKLFIDNKAIYPDLLINTVNLDEIQLEGDSIKNFDIEAKKKQYPNMFETVQTAGNVEPGNNNPLVNNPSNLSKKQQLIEDYNKAAEKRDVIRMQSIRMQINQLE
jgi:hypothetical protein